MNHAAIDFRYLLLDHYKDLGLKEDEALVILMIEHLLNQGNKLVTADLLSLKMNFKSKELDGILVNLVSRKFLEYDFKGDEMRTSIDPLRKRLYEQFEMDIIKDKASLVSANKAEALNRLFSHFEKTYKRTLSPVERDYVESWLDKGYGEEDIKNAMSDAYVAGKRSLKSVDKMLLSNRAREDIEKEGYSAASEDWNEDIERTIEIARTKWVKDIDD